MFPFVLLKTKQRSIGVYKRCNLIRSNPIRFNPIDRPNERMAAAGGSHSERFHRSRFSLNSHQDSCEVQTELQLQAPGTRRRFGNVFPLLSSPPPASRKKLSTSRTRSKGWKSAAFVYSKVEESQYHISARIIRRKSTHSDPTTGYCAVYLGTLSYKHSSNRSTPTKVHNFRKRRVYERSRADTIAHARQI